MKRLLVVILICAGLWAGYWWISASSLRSNAENWFADRRADGWVAEYNDLDILGFPNRLDVTFTDIDIADPDAGWAWQSDFLQIFRLTYKPRHLILAWPHKQQFSTPQTSYTLTSNKMQASVVFGDGAQMPIDRANLAAETLALTDRTGGVTAMTALRLAVARVEGTNDTYHLGWSAENLAPPSSSRLTIDTNGALPQSLDAFHADITVSFAKPWDRSAVETDRPQPTRITVKLAEARWGELQLAMAGELEVAPNGQPTGRLTVKARNWQDILQMARLSNALPEDLIEQLETGLGWLSQISGNSKTLDIPLDFAKGRVYLGPIPIAASPSLVLR